MNLKTFFLLTSILTMCFSNIKAQNSELILNDVNIQQGSGEFLIEGGLDSKKHITVHYHKPKKFNSDSHVVMVIPGAGRNGDDYGNAWIEQSEKYNVLVLSPEYSEKHYPRFWNYNLGGMINDETPIGTGGLYNKVGIQNRIKKYESYSPLVEDIFSLEHYSKEM